MEPGNAPEKEPRDAALRKKEKSGGRALYFIVGICVIALSAVGAVRLIRLAADRFKANDLLKQQAVMAEYNRYLIPAAAIDIEPFDDISAAKPETLVELAVWSVLNASPDPTALSYASDGSLLLPAAMVEQAFRSYFGPTVQISHRTVEGYGYEFTYDPAAAAYKIPLTTITPIYTPRVTQVETRGDATVLTCGFVNAGVYEQDPISGDLKAPQPDKYMKITLRGSGTEKYLSAVQTSAAPESAPVQASPAAQPATQPADTPTDAEPGTAETQPGETASAAEDAG